MIIYVDYFHPMESSILVAWWVAYAIPNVRLFIPGKEPPFEGLAAPPLLLQSCRAMSDTEIGGCTVRLG